MKTCTRCKKEYPATREYFYGHEFGESGLRSRCKACDKELKNMRYKRNRTAILLQSKKFREENRESYLARHHNYYQNRKDNKKYKVYISISRGIRYAVGERKDGCRWEELVGYTVHDLMEHLERQFTKGMTWENHGKFGWHIDHIRPVTDFNFESHNDPEFHECWSLWNLQPMWAKENISKGNRCNNPPLPLLSKEDGDGDE